MKLVIVSGKGGVGKSMLTSSLAMLFSQNKKVVAADCDVDAPDLAIWLGGIKKWDKVIPVATSVKPEINFKKCNGCGLCAEKCHFGAIKITSPVRNKISSRANKKPELNQFLCEGCGACEVICPQKAIKMKPVQNGKIQVKKTKYGFHLISGQLYPGEKGSGKIVTEIRERAEKFNYEIMLIDSAPGTGCPVIASLRDSNFAILVAEPTPSGFSDLKRVLKVVNYFSVPWGLVINKQDINPQLSDKIKKWAGVKFLGKISYDKEIFKAISSLKPILETNLKAREEIKQIYNNLYSSVICDS